MAIYCLPRKDQGWLQRQEVAPHRATESQSAPGSCL